MNMSTNESKRALITKALLIVTLLLSLLQIILSIIALSWDTFYFVIRLLPALITASLLFRYKINNGKTYPRQFTLPVVLTLAIHVIALLDAIKRLEFYSDYAFLYSLTTWKYISLYAINCGPSVVAIASMIIAGIVCLLKKEKTFFPAFFIGIAAVILLADRISQLIRGTEIYMQQFDVTYVLFLTSSFLTDVFIFVSFSVLMLPVKAEDNSLLC